MTNIILELTPRQFSFFYRVIQKRSEDPHCSIEDEPILTSFMQNEWDDLKLKVDKIEEVRRNDRRKSPPSIHNSSF